MDIIVLSSSCRWHERYNRLLLLCVVYLTAAYYYYIYLFVSCTEFLVVGLHGGDRSSHVGFRRQKSGPETKPAGYFDKARCWNDTNPGTLQQRQRIQSIGCRPLLLCLFNSTLGNLNRRKAVHGPFCRLTRKSLDGIQSLPNNFGPPLQTLKDGCLFCLVRFVRFVSWLGTVAHEPSHTLAVERTAKCRRCQFVDLVDDEWIESCQFHVSTPPTAFSEDTLGGGMKRGQLDGFLGRFQEPKVISCSLAAVEFFSLRVDVFLVDLVCQQD
mmetsp:Transcript_13807/g.15839  ORF Transcript_13807/g.15839 Transcript_13807/m.15839 type:complete len:269 (+) Transcript_13807:120-926(+)